MGSDDVKVKPVPEPVMKAITDGDAPTKKCKPRAKRARNTPNLKVEVAVARSLSTQSQANTASSPAYSRISVNDAKYQGFK